MCVAAAAAVVVLHVNNATSCCCRVEEPRSSASLQGREVRGRRGQRHNGGCELVGGGEGVAGRGWSEEGSG